MEGLICLLEEEINKNKKLPALVAFLMKRRIKMSIELRAKKEELLKQIKSFILSNNDYYE